MSNARVITSSKGSGGFVESGGVKTVGPPSPAFGRDDPARLPFVDRIAVNPIGGIDELEEIAPDRCRAVHPNYGLQRTPGAGRRSAV